ncbi:MAG: phosphoglycerate dehydrogenase [Phycisphaerales bacterium]|nr:phosphoglycerate dehydrogenase [Phycisphaerales bacterium]
MKTSFPKDKIRAVLLESIHPAGVEMLEREGFAVETRKGALEGRHLETAIKGAHLLGIRSKTAVTPEVLAAGPRLLTVGCFCIGTNQVALNDACHRGVPVFNSPFSNTRSVAELTIAEIVALARRLTDKSAQMHHGLWDKSAEGAHEVRGRTVGIVGYGHIGSQVSVLAEAMGMRVIFHDIIPKLALGNARPARSLNELLEAADVVTLHVPATPLTENLIGPRQIAKMRPGALLINNARGSVVDLAALAAALKAGKLGGAALDVFPDEPAAKGDPFDSPVRGLSNVILTPHVGGSTEEAQEAIAVDVCTKLIRFINNGSTTGSVNVPQVELPEQASLEPDGDERPARKGERLREDAARRAAPPGTRRHRILHFHRNVPGVLRQMHDLIAGLGANIAAEYLQTTRDVGYVVLDVDPTDAGPIMDGLKKIPETIRVRALW